jgi:hypothetical protein
MSNINIGNASGNTNRTITIGNITGTTTNQMGNIKMGNATNNLTTDYNGTVSIEKLQVGGSQAIRDIRFGVVINSLQRDTYTFPTAMIGIPTIIIAQIQSSNNTQVFSVNCDEYATTGFRFTKNYITQGGGGGGAGESFVYIAIYN